MDKLLCNLIGTYRYGRFKYDVKRKMKKYYDNIGYIYSHLEELGVDVSLGDYIGYAESEDRMRYYSVTNDGRVTSDLKHTIGGYKAFYRTIVCAYVTPNQFNGI